MHPDGEAQKQKNKPGKPTRLARLPKKAVKVEAHVKEVHKDHGSETRLG